MEYYHDLVTEKSWQELKYLSRSLNFVLIGGWAVYLYTRQLKSKDIDIIVDFNQLPVLEKNYALSKNDRLKKYEAVKEEVQIDVYLPHYSRLGLPVEDLLSRSQGLEGFKVLDADYLAVLKIFTLRQRGRSPKGGKDFLDIISLIISMKVSLPTVRKIVSEYRLSSESGFFREMLSERDRLLELNLNPHQYARVKKQILAKLF